MTNADSPNSKLSEDDPFKFSYLGDSEPTSQISLQRALYRHKVLDLLLWLLPNFVVAMASCVWALMVMRRLGVAWAATVIALLLVSLYSISQRRVLLLFSIRCIFLAAGSAWAMGIQNTQTMNQTDSTVFFVMALVMCGTNTIHLAIFAFRLFRQAEESSPQH